jgi:hypothetical protein
VKRLILTAVASATVTYLVLNARRPEERERVVERAVFYPLAEYEAQEEPWLHPETVTGAVQGNEAQREPHVSRRLRVKRIARKCFGTKKMAALTSVVIAIVAATAAFAAWEILTQPSQGSGKAASLPTVTVSKPTTAQPEDPNCVPGNGCLLNFNVNIDRSGWQITEAKRDSASVINADNPTACTGGQTLPFLWQTTVPENTWIVLNPPIPLTQGSQTVSLPGFVKMATTASLGCAGMGFSSGNGTSGSGISFKVAKANPAP